MVLHYPDVHMHPGTERSLKPQSAVFLDQLVRRQAQKASEASFENSSEQSEYGLQYCGGEQQSNGHWHTTVSNTIDEMSLIRAVNLV